MKIFAALILGLALCLVSATGCSTWKSLDGMNEAPMETVEVAHPFTDIPMMKDFQLDRTQSFIYESGSGTVKVGRLFYSGWGGLDDGVKFFENEMINKGWQLVNAIRHNGMVMNYQKEGWVCTLILNHSWGKSYIEIQIGPK